MMKCLLFTVLFVLFASAASHGERPPTPQELEQEVVRYKSLLNQEENKAKHLNGLGFAHYRLHRLPEAIDAFRRAVAADPGYALAYNNLGAAYLQTKNYGKAEEAFREALRLEPSHIKAAYNLAVALFRQGRYLDAYGAYRHAQEIDAAYVKKRLDKSRAREELLKRLEDEPDNELLRLALTRLDAE